MSVLEAISLSPAQSLDHATDSDGPESPLKLDSVSPARKWLTVVALAIMSFVVALGSSAAAPGVSQANIEFHIHYSVVGALIVSVYNIGLAVGPLIVAPLSETFGRLIPYHVTNVLFTVFTIGCAVSPNLVTLIAFRMLAGLTSSAVLTVGGATISDLFAPEERGRAMAIWTFGPLMGPAVGPIIGGFLTQKKSWRSVFWTISISAAASTVLFMIVVRETYSPVLARRKLDKLRRGSMNNDPKAAEPARQCHTTFSTADLPPAEVARIEEVEASWQTRMRRSIRRPLILLFRSPVVFLFSVFIAIVFGYQFLLFVTIPTLFTETYGFSTSQVGLTYLGIAVGLLIGNAMFGLLSDRMLVKTASGRREPTPEHRLPLMIPAAFCIPVSLFIYGWAAHYKVHWIVPIFATSLLGIGLNISLMTIQVYLVDIYTLYSAAALAAATVLRSLSGCFLPLAGPPLFAALGIGWGSSALGFVSLAMTAVPFIFVRYGASIRMNPRYQPTL